MAAITVRRLDEATKQALRVRAARNGRSMEAEVREILERAVNEDDGRPEGIGTCIRKIVGEGFDLELPPRDDATPSVVFEP